MKRIILLASAVGMLAFAGCKKSEEMQMIPVSDYAPLLVGKYITYQLDSTIYTDFGVTKEVHSYEVKYEVDAEITDNLNEPAFRVVRYIRPVAGSLWTPDATFMAKNTGQSLEFVENNLRFIKLRQPISNGFSWKGNSYFDTQSQFSELDYLDDWDYQYENVGEPLTLGSLIFPSTLTVNQRDEIIGNPGDPQFYSEVNTSVEKYAQGVGLIYKDFYHDEYQPPTTIGGSGYHVDGSYGIRLTAIDYN